MSTADGVRRVRRRDPPRRARARDAAARAPASTRRCRRVPSGTSPICSGTSAASTAGSTAIVDSSARRIRGDALVGGRAAAGRRAHRLVRRAASTSLADALRRGRARRAALWSWTPDRTAGFWARRQANETAVHRYDAQLATGATAADRARARGRRHRRVLRADPVLAVGRSRARRPARSMHLHCTDGEGEWLVRLGADGVVVTREHAKGDVAARGTASDLVAVPLRARRRSTSSTCSATRRCSRAGSELVNW